MDREDVDFQTEFPSYRVADHEVYMSFTSDWMAEAFRGWWNSEGRSRYFVYAQEYEKDCF